MTELEYLHAKYAALNTTYQSAEERLTAFDQIDASLAQKTEELTRVTASREKLMQMVKSLQEGPGE